MIYSLLIPYADDYVVINLIRYLTFRSGAAVMTALIISFVFGPPIISWLKKVQGEGQPIREDGPKWHIDVKRGTPTMGGCLILLSLSISTFLWSDLTNKYVLLTIGITLGFGLIGLIDDLLKVKRRSHRGLAARLKIILQFLLAFIFTLLIFNLQKNDLTGTITFPFLKEYVLELGPFWFLFAMFVVVGASNAVNLTDGLDGLAIVPIMIASAIFAIITYLVGNSVFSQYLQLNYVAGCGELAVFCSALVGASLGFLWFNAPPASVFMGDTGSLASGGALGAISIIAKHELVLAMVGGLFVLEALSVIIQVVSFKLTGKRIFKMAPLHHHFEQKGWSESTIVIRFWIIAIILGLIGLSTLKIR